MRRKPRSSAGKVTPKRKSHPARVEQDDTEHAARSEEQVDESLKETFPASDPPSWVASIRIGKPRRT